MNIPHRIVTSGSVWIFKGNLYWRFPRQEGPRIDDQGNPRPEWGSSPGALEDAVWHPYERAEIVWDDFFQEPRLIIQYPDSECTAELQGSSCSNRHYIVTGPIVEPVVTFEDCEITVDDFEIEYTKAEHDNA